MKQIFLPLMLMFFILSGCGGDNLTKTDNGNTIVRVKKITVGVDDEFAPICFHDKNGELVGFDVDLAKETASRMGVAIEFKPIEWHKKREEITSGNIDLIWNGLDITDERKEYMIFTKPYMIDRQIILVRKGENKDIHAEGDVEGKIVGVQAGSTSEDYLNQNEELKSRLKEYRTYGKFNEVIAALKRGEIEVIICDELVARYEINLDPDQLELRNVKIGSVAEMAVGFNKNNTALRDRIQEVFDSMIDDGTAKKISEKWFKADVIKQ